MKLYKQVNDILGWLVFLVALITYTLTLESTASFWDCGEFISGAYKLEVVHPPGAPMFILIGRIFTMFATDTSTVAWMINFMSGLSSAFVILFLFWITTALAKKILVKKGEPSNENTWVIMATGAIAALTCTFTDTIWFSAVEGEVYALSAGFVMVVVWLMLKWDAAEDSVQNDKKLVLIAFLLGVSLGVHLLSLLAVPAMALIFYFKKYKNYNAKGIIIAFVAGYAVLMFVFVGVVSKLITLASAFELMFVNSFGLPFGSGLFFIFATIIIGLAGVIIYSHKAEKVNLHTASLMLVMLLIGFSTYSIVAIRASANPPINMNTPSGVFRMKSYLNREQYGDRPLFYGPHFNIKAAHTSQGGDITDVKEAGKTYHKGKDKYEIIGTKSDYKFRKEKNMYFPRLGSWQTEGHKQAYRYMLDLEKGEDPSFGDNISFFFWYQFNEMYFRYFMWNFAGRQDDFQGRFSNNHGNWISGITFFDEMRIGNLDNLTDSLKNNKARNVYFMIPFLLGLLGLYYHFTKDPTSTLVIAVLFLFTGPMQIIFSNSPPYEPRERDYTLVGSFITYSVWIGFGFLALYSFLREKLSHSGSFVISLAVCLVSPLLLATQNWDDHDRSDSSIALEFAENYLNSVDKNAIIFTQGDNDTYPLWYAQEVEGIRTDVRVVNLSLLGVDWYIDQLHNKANNAEPVKLQHTKEDYLGDRRNQVRYYETKRDNGSYYELKHIMQFIASNKKRDQLPLQGGKFTPFLPTKNIKISVDSMLVGKNNIVPKEYKDKIVKQMKFVLPQESLLKNDLIVLDIIGSNLWERPIYFAVSVSPDSYMGLGKYFQLEGLAYRIVPIESKDPQGYTGYVATDRMFDRVMNKFKFGGIERKIDATEEQAKTFDWVNTTPDDHIYLNENVLRMTMNLRGNYGRLASTLLNNGEKEKAALVLDKCLYVMPRELVPLNIFTLSFPDIYYKAGEKEKARIIVRELLERYRQIIIYNGTMGNYPGVKNNLRQGEQVFRSLAQMVRANQDKEMEAEVVEVATSVQQYLPQQR